MKKDTGDHATRFESLTRRFLTAWQSRMPGHLDSVSVTEFRALVTVDAQSEATMSEVARALGLTLGATTSVVDRVVSAGLAVREHDSHDRRVVKVKLTPAGVEKVSGIVRRMTDDMAVILQRIAPEERGRFLDTFQLIVEGSEQASAG